MEDLITMAEGRCAPDLHGLTIPIQVHGKTKVTKTGEDLKLDFVTEKHRLAYNSQIVDIIELLVQDDPNVGHCVFVNRIEQAKELTAMINERLGWTAFLDVTSKSDNDMVDVSTQITNEKLLGYVTVNVGAESTNIKRLKGYTMAIGTLLEVFVK